MARCGRVALAIGLVLALCVGVVRAAETDGDATRPEGEIVAIQDDLEDSPLLEALAPDGAPLLVRLAPESLDDLRDLLSDVLLVDNVEEIEDSPEELPEVVPDVENVELLDVLPLDGEQLEGDTSMDEAEELPEPATLDTIHQDLVGLTASLWLLAGAMLGFKIWGYFRGIG